MNKCRKNDYGKAILLRETEDDPRVKTSSLFPTGIRNPRKPLSLKEFEKRKKKRKSK